MKPKQTYVIVSAVAVLCLSVWGQSDPVAASDVALSGSVSGEQQAKAVQDNEATLQTGTPMQTTTPPKSQACDKTRPEGTDAMTDSFMDFAQGCIDCGQACTLGGMPCCGTCSCQGRFPNTRCQ